MVPEKEEVLRQLKIARKTKNLSYQDIVEGTEKNGAAVSYPPSSGFSLRTQRPANFAMTPRSSQLFASFLALTATTIHAT